MWQICGQIPQTLHILNDITFRAAQLSVSFFMETFIHAKEKVQLIKYSLILQLFISIFNPFVAYNGPLGRAADKTIQRKSRGLRMVFAAHVTGAMVARSSSHPVSQSDGPTNVPTTRYSRHSTTQICSFLLVLGARKRRK